jgi:DNA-binding NarL/FixJ family response regulator
MDRDLNLLVCVAESLCRLAQAALGIGRIDQAVRLLAAMTQLPILPDQQAEFDQILADARKKAGEPAFGTAWDTGQRMDWDALQTEIDSLAESVSHLQPISTGAARDVTKRLTRREIEVLQLLTEGRSNRSIADLLSLSERTVDNHVLHILTKLQLESRTAVATYAVRNGLA